MEKKIAEVKDIIKGFKPSSKSKVPGSISNTMIDSDFKLRLEILTDEKHDLEKKLKNFTLKAGKMDDLRLKFESLQEQHK
jgi:hypothetical protein